jgi:LysR family transcriptional regulator, transcriptional activator of nhaA
MNLQLNYHHLRYFLAVAAEGGVTAAAAVLRVSAPTLSAQVRALEEDLGTRLFHREGKGLALTDAGRVVMRYASRIFDLGDEMAEVVRRGVPAGPETVHVGIVDAVPKLLASEILIRTWKELPGLRVVAREGLPGEVFPALAAHQLDVVISNEPPPSSLKTLLHSSRVGRFAVHFAASDDVAARYRKNSGLDGFPVLLPTRESPLRRELDRWFAENGIRPEVRAEFDDSAAMFEMAAAGAGAAPVLNPLLAAVRERYGLRLLPVRTGVQEELFVVQAERQFAHEGPRVIARVARETAKTVRAAAGE